MIGDGDTADASPGPMRSPAVSWALRSSAVLLVAGWAATQYLSRVSAPSQVARAALADPVTTGSIAQSAHGVRLDPCAAPLLRR
ncbi:hypothetical protein [Methylobacterium sp. sgz302541]|uniref:hypothetical protein n=1 Tax=unclassified Methylobacterium TaxID=2615210 RepID=UPI003D32E1A4